ncbi:MAG: 1-(5-phosphoribosyl)-5-[(5-phosphoribosylamino)methylideneamino]imidazole-4-carboxamide isomerase [Oscillospiraceae bacterium]|jgi:phosphoribosylformimino-5-aminoimidazole carboxamide ribotide isomerase
MKILPAIDLKGGRVVRLLRGDYDQVVQYEIVPVDAAAEFEKCGAKNLHVVDLDGAKDGTLSNFETIASIVRSTGMFVEVGGGIRDAERIERYLDAGAGRLILGTAAVNNPAFLEDMVKAYGEHIAVGVDAKDGRVAVDGWLTVTDLDSVTFCKRMRDVGVQTIIYTDISKDGALSGTNLEIYQVLNQIDGLQIIASGGISYLHEIDTLAKMGTYGAIVGKALYSGMLDLSEVLKEAGEQI